MNEELFSKLDMNSTVLLNEENLSNIAVPYITNRTGALKISDERLYR